LAVVVLTMRLAMPNWPSHLVDRFGENACLYSLAALGIVGLAVLVAIPGRRFSLPPSSASRMFLLAVLERFRAPPRNRASPVVGRLQVSATSSACFC
jgi:hypothetical protein